MTLILEFKAQTENFFAIQSLKNNKYIINLLSNLLVNYILIREELPSIILKQCVCLNNFLLIIGFDAVNFIATSRLSKAPKIRRTIFFISALKSTLYNRADFCNNVQKDNVLLITMIISNF